ASAPRGVSSHTLGAFRPPSSSTPTWRSWGSNRLPWRDSVAVTLSGLLFLRLITALDLIEGQQQGGNATGCGPPVRKPLKVIHQPVERHLQRDERGRCLSEFAERHGAGKVFWGAQDPCEYRCEQQIHLRDHGGSHELPAHLAPPIENLTQRQPHRAA